MTNQELRAGNHTIEVTHPDKVLYPHEGITKVQVVDYYRQVAATMGPHLRDRPLAEHRYPDGIEGPDFYQKNVPDYFPDWIPRVEVPNKGGGTSLHVRGNGAATLAYLASQACLTPHAWLSRADRLERPDRLIFDLDPAGNDLGLLRFAARAVGDLVSELGLTPFLMTTGSRGYHVVVPLRRDQDFDTVRDFAHGVAERLAERHPDSLTIEQRKEERRGRLFLDYLRNGYAQTSVAPYALRARPGAPVATPLFWEELDD
ncbi:MAG TPA: non-homologous end-joining DNA ligase, partial [Acidimicrobiales bacterium]|nr:non-homologous end-joining DNA ligase [Acidimicrobiales bacterium]